MIHQIIIFSAGGRSEKLGVQTKVVLKIGFVADSWVVTAKGKELATKPILKTTLSLTLFLPKLGRISSLIIYHSTTISRNRVKDSLAIMIHYTIFQFLFRFL